MSLRALLFSEFVLALLSCGATPSVPRERCDNGRDDDGNGKVDCLDPSCFLHSACSLILREDCTNAIDDDGNNAVDCADRACDGESCGSGCLCLNGVATTEATGGGTPSLETGGGTFGGGSAGGTVAGGSAAGGAATGGGGASGGMSGGGTGAAGGLAGGRPTAGGVAGGAAGGVVLPTNEVICSDNIDNDGDNRTDCDDSDCNQVTCGSGCLCASNRRVETNCADNMDNDGDNRTDCDDSDCNQVTCGMGCVCAPNRRVEINCDDNVDNDGDGQRDCEDVDCVGVGTENCGDGIDNTCDRAVDCADPKCAQQASCSNLQDGKACAAASQCASGACLTESTSGAPNGFCSNSASCNTSTNAGCNGGKCMAGTGFNRCFASCAGKGLGATGCRVGYVCVDVDTNRTNNNSTCRPLCSSDAECAGGAAGFGCNPWSKLCEPKDRAQGRYGAPCSLDVQCEGRVCMNNGLYPNGYCGGRCRADTRNCANGGVCTIDPSYDDNLGSCLQACAGPAGMASTCRASENYKCWATTTGGPTACFCLRGGQTCGGPSDCCSGVCSNGVCQCRGAFAACVKSSDCCSGNCLLNSCL